MLETLPPELHSQITQFLTPLDLYRLGLTSKTLYAATADVSTWTRAIQRRYSIVTTLVSDVQPLHPRQLFVRLLKDYGDILGFWLVPGFHVLNSLLLDILGNLMMFMVSFVVVNVSCGCINRAS